MHKAVRQRFLAGLVVSCRRVQVGTFRGVYFLELAVVRRANAVCWSVIVLLLLVSVS